MPHAPDREPSRFLKSARVYAGPAAVSATFTWGILAYTTKEFVEEASWLYSIMSALVVTIGIGLSAVAIGIAAGFDKNSEE